MTSNVQTQRFLKEIEDFRPPLVRAKDQSLKNLVLERNMCKLLQQKLRSCKEHLQECLTAQTDYDDATLLYFDELYIAVQKSDQVAKRLRQVTHALFQRFDALLGFAG